MRITTQFLRSRAHRALHSVEYLDLSNLNVERIEKLGCCSKLRTLNLRGNKIDYISNLEACSQLWNLDLGNNQIKCLEGLSRFVALGTLVLSNNDLSWAELARIQHMHILDISLHGNPQLERDTYYRIHVIDCLPHIWMLDGRIITSAERLQVEHFFQESALTDHPVRRKLSKKHFQPTTLKNIEVNGIFGQMTTHMMRRFPVNATLNRDIDQNRLLYLAYIIEEDLALAIKSKKGRNTITLTNREFLQSLLKSRQTDRKQCNMLLLLLVASLEFTMPSHLMKASLEAAQLQNLNKVNTMELFLLPRETRCSVVSLLLSAVKLDKDMGEEGGLYDKLYLCLYYSVSELTRLAQGSSVSNARSTQKKNQNMYQESRALIAAEVIQLFCIVPKFFEYISKDVGVTQMLLLAVGDTALPDKLDDLMTRAEQEGMERSQIYEGAADMILRAIQQNAVNMLSMVKAATGEVKYVLDTCKALPRRPASSPLKTSEYHASGLRSPDKTSSRVKSAKSADGRTNVKPVARLGDQVLLGPQNIARIISIPEPDMVLVQMDVVPAETGAMVNDSKNPEAHYTYISLGQVYWDSLHCYWRPKGTVGDRITIQTVDDAEKEMISAAEKIAVSPSNVKLWNGNNMTVPSPRGATGMLASQHNLLAEQKHQKTKRFKKKSNEKPPLPVSAHFKETLNLKLEMKAMNALIESKQQAVGVSGHIPALQPEADQSVTTAEVVDALQNISHLPTIPKENKVPHLLEGCSISHTRPSSAAVAAFATITDGGSEEDFDMPPASSPRSSLESADEAELYNIRSDSRPATANRHRSEKAESIQGQASSTILSRPSTAGKSVVASIGKSDMSGRGASTLTKSEVAQGTPDAPIEIPQEPDRHSEVLEDPDSQVTTPTPVMACRPGGKESTTQLAGNSRQIRPSTAQAFKVQMDDPPSQDFSRSQSAFDMNDVTEIGRDRTPRARTQRASYAVPAGQQIGTINNGYKMIISHAGSSYHLSNYQHQRTEAWKQVSDPSIAGVSDVGGPPPQRPPSPIPKAIGKPGQSIIKVKMGDKWLAGGKDLHWETIRARPRTGHVPGWKENISPRPKSAAALRAMRRTKTPDIVTPSSMAYDMAYGRGGHQYQQVQYDSRGHNDLNYMPPVQHMRRLGTTPTPTNSAAPSPRQPHMDFRWDY